MQTNNRTAESSRPQRRDSSFVRQLGVPRTWETYLRLLRLSRSDFLEAVPDGCRPVSAIPRMFRERPADIGAVTRPAASARMAHKGMWIDLSQIKSREVRWSRPGTPAGSAGNGRPHPHEVPDPPFAQGQAGPEDGDQWFMIAMLAAAAVAEL